MHSLFAGPSGVVYRPNGLAGGIINRLKQVPITTIPRPKSKTILL